MSEPATAKGTTETDEPTRAQQQFARRVAESRAIVPDLTLVAEADVEDARPVPARDLLIHAAGKALREFPRLNGAYRDGRFERYSRVNVAFQLDGGAAPTVFDADALSAADIAVKTADLQARVAELTAPDFAGATATVLALDGVRRVIAPLQQPQAVLLAAGEIAPRAIVHDGAVVARRTMDVTLVCDHRLVGSTEAAAFLARVVALLQE